MPNRKYLLAADFKTMVPHTPLRMWDKELMKAINVYFVRYERAGYVTVKALGQELKKRPSSLWQLEDSNGRI